MSLRERLHAVSVSKVDPSNPPTPSQALYQGCGISMVGSIPYMGLHYSFYTAMGKGYCAWVSGCPLPCKCTLRLLTRVLTK